MTPSYTVMTIIPMISTNIENIKKIIIIVISIKFIVIILIFNL